MSWRTGCWLTRRCSHLDAVADVVGESLHATVKSIAHVVLDPLSTTSRRGTKVALHLEEPPPAQVAPAAAAALNAAVRARSPACHSSAALSGLTSMRLA